MCDVSGETFKSFEVLQFSMSATTTQLLSSDEFCKLRYDTILLKVHLQTFLSIPITQKYQILSCDTLVAWCTTSVKHLLAWVFRLFILLSM
jgi:hypothetical protein